MKNKRNALTALGIILAIILVGGWAFADGRWGTKRYGSPGCGHGDPYSNLTPEQREKLQAQEEKYYRDTEDLRRDLYQKRLDLRKVWIDPKADSEGIRAKQKEVFEVERRLQDKAFDHRMALRDLVPEGELSRSPEGYDHGRGYGPHHWGGHRRGPGSRTKGGYGGGPCW
jgi:Spy/CpxP family protein refolding chaperone